MSENWREELYPFRPVPDNLPWSDRICCEDMRRHMTLNSSCEQHGYNCPDRGIDYFSESYHIRAPNANYSINYCPWCGGRLTNEVKYPKKITRKDFDQLLCHDCALPLKDVMCGTCCECIHCFKDECVGKYRWMIEEQPGGFSIWGSSSIYAPKHTDPVKQKDPGLWLRLLKFIGL